MSLEPISNDTVLEVEKLLKQGYSYRKIKKICDDNNKNISLGSICKISQGKITSDRIIEPKCDNRIEELSILLNLKKKEYNDLINSYNKLLLDNTEKSKKNIELTQRIEELELKQEELTLRNKELRETIARLQKTTKGSQDDFRNIKRNILSVKSSNAIQEPSRALKNDEMDLFGSSETNEEPKEKPIIDLFHSSAF